MLHRFCLFHMKSSYFWKCPEIYYELYMSCTYGQSLNYAYECRAETLQDTDIRRISLVDCFWVHSDILVSKTSLKRLLRSSFLSSQTYHFSPSKMYWRSEAVVQRSSVKKVFLEISQNSQENTCTRVSFFNKVAGLRPASLLKERL